MYMCMLHKAIYRSGGYRLYNQRKLLPTLQVTAPPTFLHRFHSIVFPFGKTKMVKHLALPIRYSSMCVSITLKVYPQMTRGQCIIVAEGQLPDSNMLNVVELWTLECDKYCR